MEHAPEMTERLLGWFWADPLRGAAAVACIVALATTPIAFLVLSRTEYLYARRGRTYRKPEFWSVACGMALVMGVPAIVLALLVKSQYFDESRYAFDPNQTLTVLDQGRQFDDASQAFDAIEAELARVRSARSQLRESVAAVEAAAGPLRDLASGSPELAEALEPAVERIERLNAAVDLDAYDPEAVLAELDTARERLEAEDMKGALVVADDALRVKMKALAEDRKELTEEVKAIDEALLPLRAAAEQSAKLDEALSPVLDGLVSIRRGIGLDAPQQLEDLEAPPVEVTRLAAALNRAGYGAAPVIVSSGAAATPAADVAPGPAAAPPGPGLSTSEHEAELANVPAPQRELAGLLPLTNLPEGWEIGRSGDHYLETFNAENLYEKIDGRAESFLQYDVVGMAYTYYHPEGSEANEVQLYIFEMANPLKALGKYGTEKPEEPDPLELGSDGYASGASVFFHAKSYYVQVVPTSESEEFRSFALAIARRISNAILPGSAPDPSANSGPGAVASAEEGMQEPAADASAAAAEEVDPTTLFALLPEGPGKSNEQYVAQDVFGYAFLSDVFLANYGEGDLSWQGFIRPYATPERARAIFDQYRAEAVAFDARITEVESDAADAMFVAENFGLVEVVFLKGNAVGGVNGATDVEAARSFAQSFATSLPATAPHLDAAEPADSEAETEAAEGG